jgi:hypothetical protein
MQIRVETKIVVFVFLRKCRENHFFILAKNLQSNTKIVKVFLKMFANVVRKIFAKIDKCRLFLKIVAKKANFKQHVKQWIIFVKQYDLRLSQKCVTHKLLVFLHKLELYARKFSRIQKQFGDTQLTKNSRNWE